MGTTTEARALKRMIRQQSEVTRAAAAAANRERVERDALIRRGVANGIAVREIVLTSGLTRAEVYRIIDASPD